jgi:hypothetical protein
MPKKSIDRMVRDLVKKSIKDAIEKEAAKAVEDVIKPVVVKKVEDPIRKVGRPKGSGIIPSDAKWRDIWFDAQELDELTAIADTRGMPVVQVMKEFIKHGMKAYKRNIKRQKSEYKLVTKRKTKKEIEKMKDAYGSLAIFE